MASHTLHGETLEVFAFPSMQYAHYDNVKLGVQYQQRYKMQKVL